MDLEAHNLSVRSRLSAPAPSPSMPVPSPSIQEPAPLARRTNTSRAPRHYVLQGSQRSEVPAVQRPITSPAAAHLPDYNSSILRPSLEEAIEYFKEQCPNKILTFKDQIVYIPPSKWIRRPQNPPASSTSSPAVPPPQYSSQPPNPTAGVATPDEEEEALRAEAQEFVAASGVMLEESTVVGDEEREE